MLQNITAFIYCSYLGTQTTWLATVNINDQSPQVYFSVGRAPKVDECILGACPRIEIYCEKVEIGQFFT